MTTDHSFAGSIPEIYDTLLVPMIFQEYAVDLAACVMDSRPGSVLETAAGTGVLTRVLASLLPDTASYTVTDLNQPMLDRAAAVQKANSRITWSQADAVDLHFNDAAFDTVVCQFGVMFFPDRLGCYREVRRVLRPNGTFVFNSWDDIGSNDFARLVSDAVDVELGADAPSFLERVPHGYHDVDLIRAELAEAGFSAVSVNTHQKISMAASPRDAAVAYCYGTPLKHEIERLGPGRLERVTDRAARAIAVQFGEGPVSAEIRGHQVVAAQ